MSRFWRVDKALEDSEGLRRIEFHRNPSLRCSGGNVLLPGTSAPTNDAINHKVGRGAPIRVIGERGSNKRQTPHPGEE
jgi:hypothetical protein